ncbi:MAG: DUF6288 domain-containing protein [Planctomycetota bacterium]|jgi:hypothetical protein
MSRGTLWSAVILVTICGSRAARAGELRFFHEGKKLKDGTEFPWGVKSAFPPDDKVGGWYVNLGQTGIRAKLSGKSPLTFEVMYVFEGSPAAGRIVKGDLVVGVNGRRFREPLKKVGKGERPGAMVDFGNALEESEGNPKLKGIIELVVLRDKKSMKVPVKIKQYGRFAKGFPYGNCRKTQLILQECCDYLVKTHGRGRKGQWASGRYHVVFIPGLALMATGDRRYMPVVKSAAKYFTDKVPESTYFGGWLYSFAGIFLSEYYHVTKDRSVLKELEHVNAFLVAQQYPRENLFPVGSRDYDARRGEGGFGHRGWGTKDSPHGYGAFNVTTAPALAAWSLMQRTGIDVPQKSVDLAHAFVERGTSRIGYVWYKDKVRNHKDVSDLGRTGSAVLAHVLSPTGGQAYLDYATRGSRLIATYSGNVTGTHASSSVGLMWSVLGTSATSERDYAELMGNLKWFINLMHCHDGSFFPLPFADTASQMRYGPRVLATANVALALAAGRQKLRVTGALLHSKDKRGSGR